MNGLIMAITAQILANRRNALKSTGPPNSGDESRRTGRVFYAKQTQFPKSQNEHKLSFSKGL